MYILSLSIRRILRILEALNKHCELNTPKTRASLVAQLVKNLPAMKETRVQPLDQEDPLEKEMATHFSIVA